MKSGRLPARSIGSTADGLRIEMCARARGQMPSGGEPHDTDAVRLYVILGGLGADRANGALRISQFDGMVVPRPQTVLQHLLGSASGSSAAKAAPGGARANDHCGADGLGRRRQIRSECGNVLIGGAECARSAAGPHDPDRPYGWAGFETGHKPQARADTEGNAPWVLRYRFFRGGGNRAYGVAAHPPSGRRAAGRTPPNRPGIPLHPSSLERMHLAGTLERRTTRSQRRSARARARTVAARSPRPRKSMSRGPVVGAQRTDAVAQAAEHGKLRFIHRGAFCFQFGRSDETQQHMAARLGIKLRFRLAPDRPAFHPPRSHCLPGRVVPRAPARGAAPSRTQAANSEQPRGTALFSVKTERTSSCIFRLSSRRVIAVWPRRSDAWNSK